MKKKASDDCKQIIKVEKYVATMKEAGMEALQAAIDDVHSRKPGKRGVNGVLGVGLGG